MVVFKAEANAQAFSVSVDPPLTYIEALPPVKVETPIAIANHGDSPIKLAIRLKPFTARNEGGELELLDEPLSIASFIKLIDKGNSVEEFILAPGEQRVLTLVIDVQDSLSSKDYPFSIIFQAKHALIPETLSENKEDEEHVLAFSRLLPAVATNVILSVGPWDQGLLDASLTTNAFYESGPVDFTVRITNNTKRATQAEGEIFIQNLFGQTIGKVDLLPSYVLAQTARRYEKLRFDEPVLLGPYLATLHLRSPQNEEVTLKQTRFLAAPRKALVGAVIMLLLLTWIAFKIKKRLDFSH